MPCALIGGGNHQVLAAKKYAMIAVSIQTTGARSIDSPPLRDPSSLYCIRTWNETSTFDEGRATPVAFFVPVPKSHRRRVIRYGRIRESNQMVFRVAGHRVVG